LPSLAETVGIWLSPDHTRTFYKGRVALYALLRAAGIGPGDEVVVPGFTCVVVPAAIGYTGASPVYYDIDARTLNGDPDPATAAIGGRTRAVIVQHTFGTPADLGSLPQLCRERGVLLIEDCAHAIGATRDHQAVGTLGDAAFCSLQWSKPATIGLGGIARFNDADLGHRLDEEIAAHFRDPDLIQRVALDLLAHLHRRVLTPANYWQIQSAYRWAGRHGLVQGSSAPGELVDAGMPRDYRRTLGRSRERRLARVLGRVPETIVRRRALAAGYRHRFNAAGWWLPAEDAHVHGIHLRFPLLVENRDEVLRLAQRGGFQVGDWFNAPLHPDTSQAAAFGYRAGMCPQAEWAAARLINLPTGPRVTSKRAEEIASFVLRVGTPAPAPNA